MVFKSVLDRLILNEGFVLKILFPDLKPSGILYLSHSNLLVVPFHTRFYLLIYLRRGNREYAYC